MESCNFCLQNAVRGLYVQTSDCILEALHVMFPPKRSPRSDFRSNLGGKVFLIMQAYFFHKQTLLYTWLLQSQLESKQGLLSKNKISMSTWHLNKYIYAFEFFKSIDFFKRKIANLKTGFWTDKIRDSLFISMTLTF